MCGIAGVVGLPPAVANPAAARMLAALRHRGPDGDGVIAVPDPAGNAPPVVLAHARLAVLDTSAAGRQPMPDPVAAGGPRVWLTYNGEIYNFHALRDELAGRGLHGRTGTDTEVVLLAHRVWGGGAVERFRGMFAFALADPAGGRVWLARDRLGVKPLYLFRPAGGGLLFASEVRALLAAGPELVPPKLSRRAVESFLAQGAVFGLDAHIDGVRLLSTATTVAFDWGGNAVETRQYWVPPFVPPAAPHPDRPAAVERLAAIAREAVRGHLLADVPVGVFLSAGVDSNAVAALAREVSTGPVRTISVGFDRPEFDETADAARFARDLGTEHSTVRITAADIRTDLGRVLAAADGPTVDGFNTYCVSRAARQAGVTVALSGLGGDELFGGYASFRDVPRAARLARFLRPRAVAGPVLRRLAGRVRSRSLLKLAEAAGRPAGLAQYYLLRRELFLPAERRALLPSPDGCDRLSGLTDEAMAGLTAAAAGLDPENAVSALELSGYTRDMLLRDADVFSMAHGLELRVPLLDHELVEAAAGLPGAWKRPGGPVPKPLLVEAVGRRLPEGVTRLPKRGFTFPWADWFRGELAGLAAERLADRRAWADLGFDPAAPAELWERFRRRDPAVGGLHVLALVALADLAARQKLSVG